MMDHYRSILYHMAFCFKRFNFQISIEGTFEGLVSLNVLNLHANRLQILPRLTLGDLVSLHELNMTDNGLDELTQDVFTEVIGLRVLSTDYYKFCCIARQGQFQKSFDRPT